MMTVGNSAQLLEAAQTCFVSPFPAPAPRQPGGRGVHGTARLGPGTASLSPHSQGTQQSNGPLRWQK